MKYVITFTTTDADGNGYTTARTITATDARTAHTIADGMNTDGAQIRVYPSTADAVGIMRGAVMVARRTAVNAVMRQGTTTQHRIEREYAAINARLVGAETAERIAHVMADYSADTQDMYSVALDGLITARHNGADISEQYHNAYVTLNRYLHAQRAATEYELSTEFIKDGGGDLVAINTAIAQIIHGGNKWTPTDGGNMNAATAARLGVVISAAMRLVSPTQRKIAELLARGYSQRHIAETTGRALSTVEQNIAITRGKIADYIRDNAPEFIDLIHGAETAAAAKIWTNGGRTAASTERKNHDPLAAARMREYRKRKAAERAAANK